MMPTRGRAPIGARCLGRAPQGHWKTTTFVCALRTTGLVAPLVLDSPMNGHTFRAWVEQMLVPVLRPGDVVVLDNHGSHKVSGIAEAIQAAGAQLPYLPPIVLTTTRSSRSLPSSKRCSERRPSALSKRYGTPLAAYSTDFLRMNANAIFAMRVTVSQRENALMTVNSRAECDQEALISFESGLPLANSVTLRKVVSLIVVIASRVKNA
jgi:hypothetical protein